MDAPVSEGEGLKQTEQTHEFIEKLQQGPEAMVQLMNCRGDSSQLIMFLSALLDPKEGKIFRDTIPESQQNSYLKEIAKKTILKCAWMWHTKDENKMADDIKLGKFRIDNPESYELMKKILLLFPTDSDIASGVNYSAELIQALNETYPQFAPVIIPLEPEPPETVHPEEDKPDEISDKKEKVSQELPQELPSAAPSMSQKPPMNIKMLIGGIVLLGSGIIYLVLRKK